MDSREAFTSNFREIHPKFTRFYAAILGGVDLTLPQCALLNQLMLLGSISMTEISTRLEITKPAVTNLVDRLEEKKFLKRSPHSEDRRVVLLDLLPKGAKIVSRIQASGLDMLLKTYDEFNSSERRVISRFYAALSKTMDEFLARAKSEK